MGWLIAIGILVLIAILPIGVSLVYHAGEAFCWLLFGLVKIRMFPRGKKKKEKPPKNVKNREKGKLEKADTKPKGSWKDFLPIVRVGVEFLGKLRHKIRVKRLELNVVMAGEDPCDLALNYGRVWAGVGNLMPLLEQIFVIKKRDIQVKCDFTAEDTKVSGRLDITITVGRAICLAIKYGVKALREYFKIIKLRKGGADS